MDQIDKILIEILKEDKTKEGFRTGFIANLFGTNDKLTPDRQTLAEIKGHTLGQLLHMAKANGASLTFDDVTMIPGKALKSRLDADPTIEIYPGFTVAMPIFAANMECVSGPEMLTINAQYGGVGFSHQFHRPLEKAIDLQVEDILKVKHTPVSRVLYRGKEIPPTLDSSGNYRVGAAIGINGINLERAARLADAGVDLLVIDIAHGYNPNMLDMIEKVKKNHPYIPLFAGNITEMKAAYEFIQSGVDGFKVGIGPGVSCITRSITGHGVPQITAARNVYLVAKKYGKKVISDGGIRHSGDATKALVFADAVMIGGLLGATDQSNNFNKRIDKDNLDYVWFWGSASRHAKNTKEKDLQDAAEGVHVRLERLGSTSDLFNQLYGGILSGMSYTGGRNIAEFREKARFTTQTASAVLEGSKNYKVYQNQTIKCHKP